ncbi:MAG: GTP-binding protein Era, partial [Thermoproteota archaeon]
MLLTDQNPFNKSIMVSLLGKPNAGKSSLVNYLLGFDLTIVSSKPQTTRNQFHCNFTVDHTEVILVDTPGIHTSSQELNKRMVGQAQMASEGVDLNLLLLDLTRKTKEDLIEMQKNLEGELTRTWVIFTKNDIAKGMTDEILEAKFEMVKEYIPSAEKFFSINVTDGQNIHLLTGQICDIAQSGPHHYPMGDVSNKNERFFAGEYIREQAFKILSDELPYELAVVIDEFKDMK